MDSLPAESQGNPRILEWVTYPSSIGSSQPRNRTGAPAWQAYSLPAELSGKPHLLIAYSTHSSLCLQHPFYLWSLSPCSNSSILVSGSEERAPSLGNHFCFFQIDLSLPKDPCSLLCSCAALHNIFHYLQPLPRCLLKGPILFIQLSAPWQTWSSWPFPTVEWLRALVGTAWLHHTYLGDHGQVT